MRRIALLVVLLGLVAAGCTTVSGQPTATGSDRPRDIRLDAIDPCSLFTPAVQKQLGITRPLKPDKGASIIYKGDVPSCDTRGDESLYFTVGVTFALLDGIDLYQADRVNGVLTPTQVQGFPALVVKQDKYTDECAVVVDVHPGQLLDVTYADGGNNPRIAQDELCVRAKAAADLTTAQLLRQA